AVDHEVSEARVLERRTETGRRADYPTRAAAREVPAAARLVIRFRDARPADDPRSLAPAAAGQVGARRARCQVDAALGSRRHLSIRSDAAERRYLRDHHAASSLTRLDGCLSR